MMAGMGCKDSASFSGSLGGAVANALFDATGKRLYRLPLTPERVKAALAMAPGK